MSKIKQLQEQMDIMGIKEPNEVITYEVFNYWMTTLVNALVEDAEAKDE